MDKTYGCYSDEDLNEWQRKSGVEEVLTSSAMGAWLMRRDERKEENKHKGKWIKDRDTVKCSCCGFGYFPGSHYFKDGECISGAWDEYYFKSCPECRTKMEGVE